MNIWLINKSHLQTSFPKEVKFRRVYATIAENKHKHKNIQQYQKDSTNIRMEAQAIIAAIGYAREEGCEIHTDSEFWINVLTKWAPTWKANGWKKKSGPIKNLELVQKAYDLYSTYPVKLIWVHGHSGVEMNELTDYWANQARAGATMQDWQDYQK